MYALTLGMLQFELLFKYITAVYLRNTVKFISNITYTNKKKLRMGELKYTDKRAMRSLG